MDFEKKWKKKRKGPLPEAVISPKDREETPDERKVRIPNHEKPKGDDHLRLPSARVRTSPVKGELYALPHVGYMSVMNKTTTPLVMVIFLLLRRSLKDQMVDFDYQGQLEVAYPYFNDTEAATVAELERWGWDGRVWPPRLEVISVDETGVKTAASDKDSGWPEDDPEARKYIETILEKEGLVRTLTFPMTEGGPQPIDVRAARGPFLLPVLPEPEEPNKVLIESLQTILKEGVSLFYR